MSDLKEKFPLPSRYERPDTNGSVWEEYGQLAVEYKPIDLGNGFPNFHPPQYVKDALKTVAESTDNTLFQYTRSSGHPRLVQALSKLYSQLIGRPIDPWTEILTAAGAYKAIFCTIMGLIDKGDEVIIMEPFYDCYEHNIKTAGGVPRHISLKLKTKNGSGLSSADFVLDKAELEAAFNEKTKALIVNTPHNPLGKVFSYEELSQIAELCKKWNVVCISDEVYEFLVFDSKKHIKMATLPGMWERTLTIGSAGKMFGTTGFKLGWVYGPASLLTNIRLVEHNCVRVGNTMLQETAAICVEKELSRLGQDESYFISLAKEVQLKRDYLYNILKDVGMRPILPEGGYFIVADWSPLEDTVDLSQETDKYKNYRFTKWMTKNVGFHGMPLAPFYSKHHKHLGEPFARYCFVKTDETLRQAAQVLQKWRTK